MYLDFFTAFLRRCQFTCNFVAAVEGELMGLVQRSRVLGGVARALGALEGSRRGDGCRRENASDEMRATAYVWYGRALGLLRGAVGERDIAGRDDVVWSSFLLGLFEVSRYLVRTF